MSNHSDPEIILAEEQAVVNRGVGVAQQVESVLGFGPATEGTLVLTDRRLVYARGAERKETLRTSQFGKRTFLFADVEDLDSIAPDPANFTIQIESIVSVKGHRGEGLSPRLEVHWQEGATTKVTEFVEQLTGASRHKNLDDWAPVVDRLKRGEQRIEHLPPLPSVETLDGEIAHVLGDMEEKGIFTIEEQTEEEFKIQLDSDEVEEACERLVAQGLVSKNVADAGGFWYRKRSPLGDADLSG
jgi:hypothetical protein